jgi:hypothetical protein
MEVMAYNDKYPGKTDGKVFNETTKEKEVYDWFVETIRDDFVADATDESWFMMIADFSYLVASTAGFERYWQPESDLAPDFKPLLDNSMIQMSEEYFKGIKRV